MYVIKNAFRCIARAKGRNILIGLVVLLLSVSACIGLSIKQANKTVKKQYADSMEISGTLNAKNMRENGQVTLETLKSVADNDLVKKFYYSTNVYFAAGDGIEPLDVAGSFKKNKDFKNEHGDIENGHSTTSSVTADTTANTNTGKITLLANDNTVSENTESKQESEPSAPNTPQDEKQEQEEETKPQAPEKQAEEKSDTASGDSAATPPTPPQENGGNMPNGRGGDTFITQNFFFNLASKNDFTVMAFSDNAGLPEYISSLNVIKSDSTDLNCVISKSLAEQNSLTVGSTFTLKNPENDSESFTFTVAGICDTSKSSDGTDTSSNAAFTDNCIYVSGAAVEKILEESSAANGTGEDSKALTATYGGTYVFANLDNYNAFLKTLDENYTLFSEDVNNYTESISQLETLGKYATYFLIVIFTIGAFVLIIINIFSIRNRKYEIGVLTAIGMKKYKVALQFVTEIFAVTFAALIIGSAIGAVTSVPVTNSLLVTINSEETADMQENTPPDMANGENTKKNTPPDMPSGDGFGGRMQRFGGRVNNYIASVSSATDLTVILEMILVGLFLTLVSSAAAITFVMRYEPLKILNNRD